MTGAPQGPETIKNPIKTGPGELSKTLGTTRPNAFLCHSTLTYNNQKTQ